MNQRAIPLLLLCLLAGCSSTTPHYDARFGEAVRTAKLNMMINPDAGQNPDPVAGLDGVAAREGIARYQESFLAPPQPVNVINIGGGLGK
jgi:uncharacterized protein YceK